MVAAEASRDDSDSSRFADGNIRNSTNSDFTNEQGVGGGARPEPIGKSEEGTAAATAGGEQEVAKNEDGDKLDKLMDIVTTGFQQINERVDGCGSGCESSQADQRKHRQGRTRHQQLGRRRIVARRADNSEVRRPMGGHELGPARRLSKLQPTQPSTTNHHFILARGITHEEQATPPKSGSGRR